MKIKIMSFYLAGMFVLTLHDPGAPLHRKGLASTMSEPRTEKNVTAKSLMVRHRMSTANRPLPKS